MLDTIEIIERLGATAARKEKEAILAEAFLSGNRMFFEGVKLAFDVMVTFGVAKVAEIIECEDAESNFSFDDFRTLANRLRSGELTGHAARDAINAAALSCDPKTWNLFYRRILLKKLRLGITEDTVNRVLTELAVPEALAYVVPVFPCQLAQDGELPQHRKHLRGPKLLDVKLDGVRLVTLIDKARGLVTHYTRNGLVNENFPAIREALTPLLDILPVSVVLDGEVVTETFQDLMSKIRKKGADTSQAKLALFDVIPLADFLKGSCATTQADRHAILSGMQTSGLFDTFTKGRVYVLPKMQVDLDTPEGQAAFEEFNRAAIAAGLEGIMIKDPNAPYHGKRSVAWLKKKPKISVTLTIVDFKQGDADGRNKDRLGAFVCEGEDNGVRIRTSCGGGMSDADRDLYWRTRESLLGMLVEVEGDKLTLEEDSDVWSVRFPVLKGFRGTTPGEKM